MVVDYPVVVVVVVIIITPVVVVVVIIAYCGFDADGHDKIENHIIGHAIAYMEAYDQTHGVQTPNPCVRNLLGSGTQTAPIC